MKPGPWTWYIIYKCKGPRLLKDEVYKHRDWGLDKSSYPRKMVGYDHPSMRNFNGSLVKPHLKLGIVYYMSHETTKFHALILVHLN